MEELRFLTAETAEKVRQQFGTPCYVYDEASLRANAAKATAFPNAYGASPCPPARDAHPAPRLVRKFCDDAVSLTYEASPAPLCLSAQGCTRALR